MMIRLSFCSSVAAMAALGLCLAGCTETKPLAKTGAKTASGYVKSEDSETDRPAKTKRSGPVQLGGGAGGAETQLDPKAVTESIVAALQPLQVLLGKWNGMSRNKSQSDQPEWVWDFRSDRSRPALAFNSDKGEYIREAKLTFLPDKQLYQLTAVDGEGQKRVLQGTFTEPVLDVPGDDNDQLQRTYKLQLTEANPVKEGEVWQIAFAQQENNRYIMEVSRRRGEGAFQRIDTVHTQREGTSFALSSTDYGDKTCVISQGLGTISVAYKDKTYWVCCTGCKAAFEEDPERWIARYEEQKKMKK